ncbi:MAG: type I-E CRISPR-associated protein Cse1/CasA, partial [Thermodesulfovibrionales bacterium]
MGEGPRFMQELGGIKDKADKNGQPKPVEIRSVETLFPGSPGEQTISQNKDIFFKRNTIKQLCPACAATALFSAQLTGAGCGAGHRVGMAGAGPLYIMPLGQTLWESVMLALCTGLEYPEEYPSEPKHLLAWVAPTQTSVNTTQTSTVKEIVPRLKMHPDHVYWPMSQRRELIAVEESGHCSVCERETGTLIRSLKTTGGGMLYAGGGWEHPHIPYSKPNKGEANSIKAKSHLAAYAHMIPFLVGRGGKKALQPPKVVSRIQASMARNSR